jgi:hypothetical protein
MPGPLGRRVPKDFRHVELYPLRGLPLGEQPTHVPMAIGVNWYSNFDRPERDADGRYWIGRGNLGNIRGGHCVCIRSADQADAVGWWDFYDQGSEGACVGFGCSRMMSLLNRRRYAARWLWNEAKMVDGFDDTNPGDDNGTTVSAGCDVLRTQGHRRVLGPLTLCPRAAEGISANRWATSWDEVRRTVGATGDGVQILNSWGRAFPRAVRLTDEAGARLLAEDGEFTVVTDR